MEIAFALVTLMFGLMLTFGGYLLARIVIPLWGFLAGFALGSALTAWMTATPFLATILGAIAGFFIGLVFAVFAYLYFSIAVIVLVGFFGYWVGSGFIMLFGIERGLLSTIIGLALGIIVAIGCLRINAPKQVLIAWTSLTGAVAVVSGLLLMFNRITIDAFYYGAATTVIADSFVWLLLTLLLTFAGIFVQVAATEELSLETWESMDEFDDRHYHRKDSSTPSKPRPAH